MVPLALEVLDVDVLNILFCFSALIHGYNYPDAVLKIGLV